MPQLRQHRRRLFGIVRAFRPHLSCSRLMKTYSGYSKSHLTLTERGPNTHAAKVRENEVFATLTDAGGVVEDNGVLIRHHQAFMRKTRNLPNDASVPALDRRTLSQALNGLEDRGLIRRLIVEVSGKTGVPRQLKLVHLAGLQTSSHEMVKFFKTLRTAPAVELRKPLVKQDAVSAVAAVFRPGYQQDISQEEGTGPFKRRRPNKKQIRQEEKQRITAVRLAQKATDMFARREKDWNTAIGRFCREKGIDGFESDVALFNIKRAFMGPGSIPKHELETELSLLLQRQRGRAEALAGVGPPKPQIARWRRPPPTQLARPPTGKVSFPAVQPAPSDKSLGERRRLFVFLPYTS